MEATTPCRRAHLLAALTLACLFLATTARAEPPRPLSVAPAPLTAPRAHAAPRIYFSCPQGCFDAYLRQALSRFDVVRDPHLADIHLLIVRQPAGHGGARFSVTTAANGQSKNVDAMVRSFVAAPGTTDHDAREELLALVLRTLHRSLWDTPHEQAFGLQLLPRSANDLHDGNDPWNHWVIAPDIGGEGDGSSGHYAAELRAGATLRRITEASKQRLRGTYARRFSGYRLEDGSRVSGDVAAWDIRALYARSIGDHWALGGTATARRDEFENLAGHLHVGALAEFNIFPYHENASRQLRVAYQAGLWANRYIEANQESRLSEWRPYHALSLIADVNQPWGSVQWVGQVNSFVDAPRLSRVSMGAGITLRLFEGLSVSVEGQAAWVNDLINLRGRSVNDVELLLWTVQQPTDHMFEIAVGFTYTFGSVHDGIVNPRFGRVDLDEE